MTVFLTTHYMDEADALCDRIMIMDHGVSLADGSAAELKDAFSRAHTYEVEFKGDPERYAGLLKEFPFVRSVERDGTSYRLTLSGEDALRPLVNSSIGGEIRRICLMEPTLEDVFIALTGSKVRE